MKEKELCKGMNAEQLKQAGKRFYLHIPQCVCGNSLTNMICDECSRLYTSKNNDHARLTVTVHGDFIAAESVNVIFNGDVTTKIFIWEL